MIPSAFCMYVSKDTIKSTQRMYTTTQPKNTGHIANEIILNRGKGMIYLFIYFLQMSHVLFWMGLTKTWNFPWT